MGIKIAPADEGQEGYKNGAMIFWSLLTPFFGTSLGAACVFFLKKGLGDRVQRGLTGFASGVMVAASIWSLLIPAMEQSAGVGGWAFLPAVTGFWAGILFLLGLDHLIPHLHQRSQQAEGPRTQLQRSTTVSYTHLDVYKRQLLFKPKSPRIYEKFLEALKPCGI